MEMLSNMDANVNLEEKEKRKAELFEKERQNDCRNLANGR